MFLSSVQHGEGVKVRNAGDPGAVAAVLAGLKFFKDHLGLNMQLDDELASAPADAEPPRPLKQAAPFSIRDLACFEQLTASPNHIARLTSCCKVRCHAAVLIGTSAKPFASAKLVLKGVNPGTKKSTSSPVMDRQLS